jgi:hypothetical protein
VPATDVVTGQIAVHLRDIYLVRRKRRPDGPYEQFYYGKILPAPVASDHSWRQCVGEMRTGAGELVDFAKAIADSLVQSKRGASPTQAKLMQPMCGGSASNAACEDGRSRGAGFARSNI